MDNSRTVFANRRPHREVVSPVAGSELNSLLEHAFGTRFTYLDGLSGALLQAADGAPVQDWAAWAQRCRGVWQHGRPEFIAHCEPLVQLALPLSDADGAAYIAVAGFLVRELRCGEDLSRAAGELGWSTEDTQAWAARQSVWSATVLRRMADMLLTDWSTRQRVRRLEAETQSLSRNLATTYEEISLLHRLTNNLKLSRSDEDLGNVALDWLSEILPAKGIALQFLPMPRSGESLSVFGRSQTRLLAAGEIPLEGDRFNALVENVHQRIGHQPLVLNQSVTEQPDWPFPEVRQLIAVALAEGENLFGWMLAINHVDYDSQFGTVEASLLSSVAAILGIHGGNIELYRQQSELLEGVVRALTSAIDAKDPYTCGHSDRVARISVRLAQELGCDAKTLNTIYLSGLLHDIGKIGVNDSVLRKPGKLTDVEYEHIKGHVEIGHRILVDLHKLDGVLPVVLHHHESWDGQGYPHCLVANDIPFTARIVSVADAFDAMGSDRPYRKGMPDDRIDEVLRSGSGKQWDPDVVEAFFRARHDLHDIVRQGNAEIAAAAANEK